ncbi:hypothetical protein LL912_17475 [Niabella sp. CC-SYL272]|uniref:hypothetical protein n=1 Tax=Niabella agricola TaxID=2891571 RepID=UPI001F48E635|nr:hypothetical protein [Niabella agricola]MCF3110581.1 hypothetical protein [Niabella agricola]
MMKQIYIFFLILIMGLFPAAAQVKLEGSDMLVRSAGKTYRFSPEFTVLFSESDPTLALKPAGIDKVPYNVPTWKTEAAKADYRQQRINESVAGDGFDDKILRSKKEMRTASIYHVGHSLTIKADKASEKGDTAYFHFPDQEGFTLQAWLVKNTVPYPQLEFLLVPKKQGYYSVGYTGAPSFEKRNTRESWQPLIWTEQRTPDQPYLTPAFMATEPTTLVNDGVNSLGVLAHPRHLPFQPLPLLDNSQFGIALLNSKAQLQPQVFAPIPGGLHSFMKADSSFRFSFYLLVTPRTITDTYEQIARNIFGFRDYRTNATVSMNTTLDNLIDYAKTHYAWFVDSLKGFAYSTDVPGAVKNVSSLNPLEMAIIRDDKELFEKRAYPLMEFMLSREKFLFSLDSTQKIQSPSRKLKGPIAPLSELGVLHSVFPSNDDLYTKLAKKEFLRTRVRNLDVEEKGANWINALFLFKMTGDSTYLSMSRKMADAYLKARVDQRMEAFGDPMISTHFFWPTFTNNWSALLELYELTREERYLKAAHDGARHYALFTWMAPAIPDSIITVNKGGKAPMYWYLKSKGHQQMYYPEEKVPAWRVSEIGLTSESSGTATGHRGIFMSTFAPWMLRIGYYTKDDFLIRIAKASLVGRSASFPGYHMNTERTTAYEKPDFPLHAHRDQSVNSFHYNHILPMASLFMDYLVSDAFIKSDGRIHFPNDYIEGYAYLQNKFYGHKKGNFMGSDQVQLWMPARLLRIGDIGLNYIAARKKDSLFIAFSNQSAHPVQTTVTVNPAWVRFSEKAVMTMLDREKQEEPLKDSSFTVTVPANGQTAVVLKGAVAKSLFQDQLLQPVPDKSPDYFSIPEGHAKALLFKLGGYGRRLFLYLEDDDNKWSNVTLQYRVGKSKKISIIKKEYPFEFTVAADLQRPIAFSLTLKGADGKTVRTKEYELGSVTTSIKQKNK